MQTVLFLFFAFFLKLQPLSFPDRCRVCKTTQYLEILNRNRIKSSMEAHSFHIKKGSLIQNEGMLWMNGGGKEVFVDCNRYPQAYNQCFPNIVKPDGQKRFPWATFTNIPELSEDITNSIDPLIWAALLQHSFRDEGKVLEACLNTMFNYWMLSRLTGWGVLLLLIAKYWLEY